ncbi:hypothetical protein AVEN_198410-1 [Araneus ventricosus]|uniref:SOCS box domain-containing protein n=1 Tax=Araneus ventricosus TaxID=182803 RepID=A0A4Y2X759_ARAVE|nr:hypothetical protein AVEN_198410-1 [Araneus ventricosus]
MFGEDAQKFSGSRVMKTIAIGLGKCMDDHPMIMRNLLVSRHRFFLILETYFATSDKPQQMQALHLLWRSIPDAVISREEMNSSLKKFAGRGDDIFKICETAVWWENEHLLDSLKHLSRCSVRGQLAKNSQMPYNKLDLDITRSLISCINLDE